MAHINNRFLDLPGSYLFSEIAQRVSRYMSQHKGERIIRLGIGDVTQPLTPAVIAALHKAVDEMGHAETFRGYGPEQGYEFLRETVVENDYRRRGIEMAADEIFISDGAKSDTGNFGDILSLGNRVAVTDPVYPVYVDSNAMAGRAGSYLAEGRWSRMIYLPCTAENDFVPALPVERPDMIYLCYPNNPTGTVLTRAQLKAWVDYALSNDALILFDSAYEAFIRNDDIPHSIYEIEGARQVAIEFRSFSKTAGFTGLRCGYTVVPHEVCARDEKGAKVPLGALWNRRQCTKFNGVPYIVQRAAQAVFSPDGMRETRSLTDYYMRNAALIRTNLQAAGLQVYGGENAPYIWVKAPAGMTSWNFFDRLLSECNIVGTPGSGFGPSGEGYLRLTAFGSHEDTLEAVERIGNWKL